MPNTVNPLRWACVLLCTAAVVSTLVLAVTGCRSTGGGAGITRPQPRVSLAGAQRAAEYSRSRGGLALIVNHRGNTILEQYHNGGSPQKAVHVRSITKNFWAVLLLMAAEDGLLELDEPASATLTEWRADPLKRQITIRQLMAQTAGLEPGFGAIYGSGARDKYAAAVALPSRAAPGASFRYGPGHYEALGELLKRKLAQRGGNTTNRGYLHARLLGPLGIGGTHWRTDRAGNPYFSAGGEVSARGLLVFGRMILQRGGWGRQHVSAASMAEAATGSRVNPAYGLSFWLNNNAARADAVEVDYERILESGGNFGAWDRACASTLAPSGTIILVGSSGQRVYIIPSLELVVVRLGASGQLRDPEFLRLLLS